MNEKSVTYDVISIVFAVKIGLLLVYEANLFCRKSVIFTVKVHECLGSSSISTFLRGNRGG